jgi:transposase
MRREPTQLGDRARREGLGVKNDGLTGVVIGYGSVGRRHARVLTGLASSLVIVDSSERAREAASNDFSGAVIADRLEALDGSALSWSSAVAVVATWGPSHASLFEAFADRGVRHVLCEKPLACSVQMADAMASRAERQFVAFLAQVVVSQPYGREIHIIADNLSAHKTKRVEQFLSEHPKVHLHFTPTYSSWLNQVEIWFSRIERHVIARGVFTSKADLARKLMRYIRAYNRNATPIKRTYSDPSTRINVARTSTVTGN